MAKKSTTYQEDLIESSKNPREAAAYLNAAMEEETGRCSCLPCGMLLRRMEV